MINWIDKKFEELNLEELYASIRLRAEVFVVEQTCPYQDCDNLDQKSIHLMGYEKDQLVAYMRIIPAGISYDEVSMGRIVTSPTVRRTGVGKELMRKGFETVETHFGATPIRISAQTYLLKFYEEFGFEFTGKEYLEDGIPHSDMLRKV